MRRRMADPAYRARALDNLRKSPKGGGPRVDPPQPSTEEAPPPTEQLDPPRRGLLRSLWEGTPADAIDKVRRRRG